jgi:hypothetical protein
MKIILVLFITSFFIKGDEINKMECEIIPFVGIGSLELFQTTFKQVEKLYGKEGYKKYWSHGEIFIGNYVKVLSYSSLGISVYFSRHTKTRQKRFGDYFLQSILLDENFKGKIKGGVGIGSSYREIVNSLGENKIRVYNGSMQLFYSESNEKSSNGISSITFTCFDAKADTLTFKVDKISMY